MLRLPKIADKKQLHDAARVAAGVCILTSVGIIAWTYGSRQGLPYLEQAAQGLQWGAITVLLVSYPVVGRTARTGVERALGTIAGGVLGFFTSWAAEGALWCVLGFLIPFSGYLWGARSGYEYAGKLFSVTWAIVAPIAVHPGIHPLVIFVARVGGILAGIATTFILACILWPRSASDEVVDHLSASMAHLQQLTELTWGALQLSRQHHEQQTLLQAVCDAMALPLPTSLAQAGGDTQPHKAVQADTVDIWKGAAAAVVADGVVVGAEDGGAKVAQHNAVPAAAVAVNGTAAAAACLLDRNRQYASVIPGGANMPEAWHTSATAAPSPPRGVVADGPDQGGLVTMDTSLQEQPQQQQQQPPLPTAVGHVAINMLPGQVQAAALLNNPLHQPAASLPGGGVREAAEQPSPALPPGPDCGPRAAHARGPSSPSMQQLLEQQPVAAPRLQRRVVSLQDLRVLGEPEWLHAANPGSLASVAQWLRTQPSGTVPPSPAAGTAAGSGGVGPGINSAAPNAAAGGDAVTGGAAAQAAAAAAAGRGGLPLGPPPTPAAAPPPASAGLERAAAPMEPLLLPPAAVAPWVGGSSSSSASAFVLAGSNLPPALHVSATTAAGGLLPLESNLAGLASNCVVPASPLPQPFVGDGGSSIATNVAAAAAALGPALPAAGCDRQMPPGVGLQAPAAGTSATICSSSSQLAAVTCPTQQQGSGANSLAKLSAQRLVEGNCSSATATHGAAPEVAWQRPRPATDLPHVFLEIPALPSAAIWDPFAAVAGCPLTTGGDASTAGRNSAALDAPAHQQASVAGASPPPMGDNSSSYAAGVPASRIGPGRKGTNGLAPAAAAAATGSASRAAQYDASAVQGAAAPAAVARRKSSTSTAAAAPEGKPPPLPLQSLELHSSPVLASVRRSSGGWSEPHSARPSRAASSRPAALLSTLSGALSWALPRQLSLPVGAGIMGRSSGSYTPRARPPTLQEAAEVLSAECPSDDATVLESLVAAAGGGRQADEVVTPEQRAQIRSTLDARCEELVFGVHKEVNAVKESLTHARSELYMGMARNHRWYLPLLLLPGQERKKPHMPEQQVQRLGLAMRRTGRLTWALHLALMDGFEEHIAAVLRARFPAQLLDKLHLAAVALLRDAAVVMAACKRGCSCQAAYEALPVMRRHLAQYIKLLNTLLEIAEQQRHQVIDHVRRYVLPPPAHEDGSPASMSARFSFDDPAVDEAPTGAGSRRRTFGERLLRAASATTPARALRRSVSSRGPRRSSGQGAGEEYRRLPSASAGRPLGVSPVAVAALQRGKAAAPAEGGAATAPAAPAAPAAPIQTAAAAGTPLTAAQLLVAPTYAASPAHGMVGPLASAAAAAGMVGHPTAAELARGFGSTWHLAGADGEHQSSPAQQQLPRLEQVTKHGRALAPAEQQQQQQQQQQQLEGGSSQQLQNQEQQQAASSVSMGRQQADGLPWPPPLNLPVRPPLVTVEEAAAVAAPRRTFGVPGGVEGGMGAAPLSPQPSSTDTLLPGALPYVDTPRLFFPDTREGYLGKMRWYSFKFLLEQLAEQYVELVEALVDLVPRLPGNHLALSTTDLNSSPTAQTEAT